MPKSSLESYKRSNDAATKRFIDWYTRRLQRCPEAELPRLYDRATAEFMTSIMHGAIRKRSDLTKDRQNALSIQIREIFETTPSLDNLEASLKTVRFAAVYGQDTS